MRSDPKPSGKFIDLEGQVFPPFTVIAYHARINKHTYWWCRCRFCEQTVSVEAFKIKTQEYKSCGCQKIEFIRQGVTTHGKRHSSIYSIYGKARERCTNPNNPAFARYGGRGIKFCFASFEEFYSHVGDRPSPHYTIDRINNDGNYEVGNLRWATRQQQNRNTSVNTILTLDGQPRCLAEWSDMLGINPKTISTRIARKWCVSCVLNPQLIISCTHTRDITSIQQFRFL